MKEWIQDYDTNVLKIKEKLKEEFLVEKTNANYNDILDIKIKIDEIYKNFITKNELEKNLIILEKQMTEKINDDITELKENINDEIKNLEEEVDIKLKNLKEEIINEISKMNINISYLDNYLKKHPTYISNIDAFSKYEILLTEYLDLDPITFGMLPMLNLSEMDNKKNNIITVVFQDGIVMYFIITILDLIAMFEVNNEEMIVNPIEMYITVPYDKYLIQFELENEHDYYFKFNVWNDKTNKYDVKRRNFIDIEKDYAFGFYYSMYRINLTTPNNLVRNIIIYSSDVNEDNGFKLDILNEKETPGYKGDIGTLIMLIETKSNYLVDRIFIKPLNHIVHPKYTLEDIYLKNDEKLGKEKKKWFLWIDIRYKMKLLGYLIRTTYYLLKNITAGESKIIYKSSLLSKNNMDHLIGNMYQHQIGILDSVNKLMSNVQQFVNVKLVLNTKIVDMKNALTFLYDPSNMLINSIIDVPRINRSHTVYPEDSNWFNLKLKCDMYKEYINTYELDEHNFIFSNSYSQNVGKCEFEYVDEDGNNSLMKIELNYVMKLSKYELNKGGPPGSVEFVWKYGQGGDKSVLTLAQSNIMFWIRHQFRKKKSELRLFIYDEKWDHTVQLDNLNSSVLINVPGFKNFTFRNLLSIENIQLNGKVRYGIGQVIDIDTENDDVITYFTQIDYLHKQNMYKSWENNVSGEPIVITDKFNTKTTTNNDVIMNYQIEAFDGAEFVIWMIGDLELITKIGNGHSSLRFGDINHEYLKGIAIGTDKLAEYGFDKEWQIGGSLEFKKPLVLQQYNGVTMWNDTVDANVNLLMGLRSTISYLGYKVINLESRVNAIMNVYQQTHRKVSNGEKLFSLVMNLAGAFAFCASPMIGMGLQMAGGLVSDISEKAKNHDTVGIVLSIVNALPIVYMGLEHLASKIDINKISLPDFLKKKAKEISNVNESWSKEDKVWSSVDPVEYAEELYELNEMTGDWKKKMGKVKVMETGLIENYDERSINNIAGEKEDKYGTVSLYSIAQLPDNARIESKILKWLVEGEGKNNRFAKGINKKLRQLAVAPEHHYVISEYMEQIENDNVVLKHIMITGLGDESMLGGVRLNSQNRFSLQPGMLHIVEKIIYNDDMEKLTSFFDLDSSMHTQEDIHLKVSYAVDQAMKKNLLSPEDGMALTNDDVYDKYSIYCQSVRDVYLDEKIMEQSNRKLIKTVPVMSPDFRRISFELLRDVDWEYHKVLNNCQDYAHDIYIFLSQGKMPDFFKKDGALYDKYKRIQEKITRYRKWIDIYYYYMSR